MVSPTPPPPPIGPPDPHLNEVGAIRALLRAIRTRIMSGLVLALPIALTFQAAFEPLFAVRGLLAATPVPR